MHSGQPTGGKWRAGRQYRRLQYIGKSQHNNLDHNQICLVVTDGLKM